MEMEEEKRLHPSLPSNYVTIAELKQRWLLKKQQEQKEEEERKIKLQEEQQQRRNGCRWKNRNDRYRPKIRTDSGNSDNRRGSEFDAAIGGENANRSITSIESTKIEEKNKKRVKSERKPKIEAKTEEKKEQKEEDSEKDKIEISSDSIVEEIEQKIEGFWISEVNSAKGNGYGRGRRGYFRHSQYQRGSSGNRNGGANFGGGFLRPQNDGREKMVWVRKNNDVGCG